MLESKPRNLKAYFAVWIVLGIIGLISFVTQFKTAFPVASLDLSMPKEKIEEKAVKFADFLSYSPDEAIVSTIFSSASTAKTFLDYKLGGQVANKLMKEEIPVFYWQTRICKQNSTEEAYVYSWTDGKVQGFYHTIAKEKKIPSISHEEAKKLVFDYAKEKTRIPVQDWKLIEDKVDKKLNRTDHIFVFEDKTRQYESARLRAKFKVMGNYVGSFDEYLHVPEDFKRHYGKLRSTNTLLRTIARSLGFVLDGAVLIIFIWALVKRMIRWRFVGYVFLTSIVVFLFAGINIVPSLIFSYDTAMGFWEYMVQNLGVCLLAVGFGGLYFSLLAASADAIYRKWAPDSIAFENLFSPKSSRQKATLVGLGFAFLYLFFSLGYQCLFYIIGQKFGVWCPLGVQDEAALGLVFSASFAMFVGYFASISEEIVYRVVGITLLTKVFRNVWIANLIQAIVWGFAHSSYPQQPAYTRGVELSIEGFISGAFFIKFGLLPSLLSHYMFNVTVSSVPSFCSDSLLSKLSSLIPYLPPLIWFACVIYSVKKSGFADSQSSGLNNKDIVPSKAPERVVDSSKLESPLVKLPGRKDIVISIILSAVIALAALFVHKEVKVIGREEKQNLSKQVVIEKSRNYLEERGISLAGYSVLPWYFSQTVNDEQELQYVLENSNHKSTRRLVNKLIPNVCWEARWYKPESPQEYYVTLDEKGNLRAININLHENDSSKILTEAEAKLKAESFLSNHHKELENWKFSSIKKEKKKNRVDYSIVYEIEEHRIGQAPFMITVDIKGDKVGNFFTEWQVPSEWKLEKEKKPLWRVALSIYFGILLVVCSLIFLVVVVKLIATEGTSIKFILVSVAIASVIAIVTVINEWPFRFHDYSTETPILSFQSKQAFDCLYTILFEGVRYALMAVLCYAASISLLGSNWKKFLVQFLPKRLSRAGQASTRKYLWLESIGVALTAAALIAATGALVQFVSQAYSPTIQMRSLASDSLFEVSSVLSHVLVSSLELGLLFMFFFPVLVLFYKRYIRDLKRATLILVVFLPSVFALNYFIEDSFIAVFDMLISLSVFYFVVAKLLKNNILAYLLLIIPSYLLSDAYSIWKYVYPNHAIEMYLLLVLSMVPVLVAIDDFLMSQKSEDRISDST